jgi:hypothetical protein
VVRGLVESPSWGSKGGRRRERRGGKEEERGGKRKKRGEKRRKGNFRACGA